MTTEVAIKLLETGSKMPGFPHTSEMVDEDCRIAVDALKKKKSKFIYGDEENPYCSKCYSVLRFKYKYCPNCGSEMEEESYAD